MPGQATVHGVVNYWLGGSQNLRADRELGRALEEEFPGTAAQARAAHAWHLDAARWCAERGVTRFIRAGAVTFLPGRNVHDTVRAVQPGAQVCYVVRDADPYALAAALLDDGGGISVIQVPVRFPARVLGAPPVAAMTAGGQPVCLILGLVLGFAPPGKAAEHLAAYAAGLPRGSYIAVTSAVVGDPEAARRFAKAFTPVRIYPYSPGDVASWFASAGLEAAGEPGQPVRVGAVRNEPHGTLPGWIAGAVGRVP